MTAALPAWLPAVGDVANLVPYRTGDNLGNLQGTFTAATNPTATQVAGLLRGVQSEVAAVVGAMPDALALVPAGGTIGESPAGHVVALGAAALVESQFYPDLQLGGGDSPGSALDRRYRAALAALAAAANSLGTGTDPGDMVRPVGTFPGTVGRGLATTPWERW